MKKNTQSESANLKKVFSSNVQESCELALPVNGNKTLYVYLTGIVAKNGNHCFVTATDINAYDY